MNSLPKDITVLLSKHLPIRDVISLSGVNRRHRSILHNIYELRKSRQIVEDGVIMIRDMAVLNDVRVIEYVMERLNIDYSQENWETFFRTACRYNMVNVLKWAKEKGHLLHYTSLFHKIHSCTEHNREVCMFLFDNLYETGDKFNAVFYAARAGMGEIIEDVYRNRGYDNIDCAFFGAQYSGRVELVQKLNKILSELSLIRHDKTNR